MSVSSILHGAQDLAWDPLKAYNFRVVFAPDFDLGNAGKALGLSRAFGMGKALGAAAAVATASVLVGGFTSIKGAGWKTEARTVREGGVNDREYKLPGQTTCNELVLTKGLTALDPMWEWYNRALVGRVQRMNGLIFLMNDRHSPTVSTYHLPTTGIPIAMWHFTRAWPTALEGVQLDASQSLLAVQSMTLAIESIQKTVSGSSIKQAASRLGMIA